MPAVLDPVVAMATVFPSDRSVQRAVPGDADAAGGGGEDRRALQRVARAHRRGLHAAARVRLPRHAHRRRECRHLATENRDLATECWNVGTFAKP